MAGPAEATILIIDDEEDVHYSFQRLLANEAARILTAASGEAGIKILRAEKPDLVVMDIRMGKENGLDTLREIRTINPKQLVIMMTAYGTSQTAIEAMKLGAFDYVLKPFDIPQLKELLQRGLEAANAMKNLVSIQVPLDPDDFRTGIVGGAPTMQNVYKLVGQVAPTDATVLIHGESGTGKELVARAIYSNSNRSDRIFMAINCAAIPDNLLESELFGHEKGAFTGASSQRVGKFEQCDGGTLFLDEIGDMPLPLQTKILRVLQEGEFSRVGANHGMKTDVRIIAATNKDLWEAVQEKEFREDLFYRLNVVSISVPPLRDRAADVPALVAYFVNKWRARNSQGPQKMADDALSCCQAYAWPGNVRELENCIQRAMVLATGDTILMKDLPPEVVGNQRTPQVSEPVPASAPSSEDTELPAAPPGSLAEAVGILFDHAREDADLALLPAVERELIVRALETTSGNQVQASKLLGITRATLRKRVEKFGIQKEMKVN